MISFHQNGWCFHLRAGGIALHEDHVLLHRLDGDEFWAIPGGRVEMGEQAGETLIREFREELGIHVTTGDLVCVGENFFDYQGEPHHEVGLYLAVELPQGSPLLNLEKTHVGTGHQAPVLQTPECGSKAIPLSHCAGSFFVLAKTIITTAT